MLVRVAANGPSRELCTGQNNEPAPSPRDQSSVHCTRHELEEGGGTNETLV